MRTDFNELLPTKQVLFSLKEVEELGIIKVNMSKKLYAQRKIEVTKIGAKVFISKSTLIRYLEENTIPAYY